MKFETSIVFLLLLCNTVKTLSLECDNSTETEHENDERAEISYRLTGNAVPVHYNVKLTPHLIEDNFTFDGETSVDLKINEPTKTVDLHTKELTLDETATYLESKDGQRYESIDFAYDNETEITTITFKDVVQPGIYEFRSKFVGILNDELHGFYRSSYENDDNETVWLATTQFEATYARQAFPCWDEPFLKATFNVSIKHYPNYTALSNMPAYERSEIDENDGKVWTHFQRTPIMSTYILAFVVSNFVCFPNDDGTINVWVRSNAISGIEFGYEVAQKAKTLLEKYTNSSVRVPKMDHVLVPNFETVAMENWGLVIYKENEFLNYPNKTKESNKLWTAMVVTHELTHQWFGNVVSPSWWGHLWLNEGFATYFQYYITDKIFPNWRLMDFFVPRVLYPAFNYDEEFSEEPLSHNVSSSTNIKQSFSVITYFKAASILRMLAHVLNDEVFRLGLIKYIHKYQYGNASPDDLWGQMQNVVDEISEVSRAEFRVKEMMDTWIYQRKYPLVTVNRNYATGEATFAQRIFTQDKNATDCDNDLSKYKEWWIPINYVTRTKANFSNTLPSHWLKPYNGSVTIDGIDEDDWLIVNVQQTGHYRVNYDERNWMKLAEYLNTPDYEKIHPLNRVQIIKDYCTLLFNKKGNATIFFELSNYLSRETDYIVWSTVLEFPYNELHKLLETTEGHQIFRPHFLNLMSAFLDELGFDVDRKDESVVTMEKLIVQQKACSLGHPECNRRANEMLVEFLESPNKDEYPNDLKEWIFFNGMNNANESTWDQMNMYLNREDFPLSDYLGLVKNLTVVEKYLSMIIAEDSPFLNENRQGIFEPLFYSEPAVAMLTTDFVMNHWDELTFCNVSANETCDSLSNEVSQTTKSSNGTPNKYVMRVLGTLMIEGARSFDHLRKVKTFLEKRQVSRKMSDRIDKKEADLEFAERFFEEFRAWQKSKESNAV